MYQHGTPIWRPQINKGIRFSLLRQAVCVMTSKGSWVKLLVCLISIVTWSSTHLVGENSEIQNAVLSKLKTLRCWKLLQRFTFRSPSAVPWVPEVFVACSENFRCWLKADTSSAVGRIHEQRSREKNLWHGAMLFTVPVDL